MFQHSIKVPRLYKTAAKLAREASENGSSIKQLVYETKHINIKGLYALIAETTKRKEELDYLIRKSKILEKESRLDPWLCRVLITELLWGKKRLLGESKPLKTVLAYKQILSAHATENTNTCSDKNDSSTVAKPKFVRVNTLKTTVDEIINLFRDEGWTLVRHLEDKNYENFLTKLSSLSPEEFMLDLHVKDLLIFPPKTEFHQYPFYKDGRIMIQDKASCLPAILLNPEPGSTVLDTCAAPGMKTTQMAALMKNEGTIFAVEFNTKRFVSLNKMVESSGATCVKTINRDVITLTSQDCPNVDYVLIDPSCSGSGIVDRNDFDNKREIKTNLDRLEKLAGFQIKILKTALNRFPKAKRIVYSTCSLYTQENEEVVKEVLASNTKFKLVPADKFLTAPWNSFGSAKYGDIGKFCLYSRPEKDHTNGFFVAVFERLEEGEENPFIVIDLERKPKGKKDVEIVSVTTIKKKNKNKKKKDSVVDLTSSLSQTAGLEEDSQDNIQKLKKKKRHNSSDTLENNEHEIVISEHQNGFAKDKKKRKQSESLDNCDVAKKRENMENGDAVQNGVDVENNSLEAKKKKRKRDKGEEALPDTVIIDCDNDSGNCDKKSKKKKRTKQDISTIEINHTNQEDEEHGKAKKGKKKSKNLQYSETTQSE